MGFTDENLGHRSTPCDAHHVFTDLGLGVNSNFFNVSHTFGLQNLLGTNAIRADCGGVHLHVGHDKSNQKFKIWQGFSN
jgi:hypothetical protein